MIPTINNKYNTNFRSIKLSEAETKNAAAKINKLLDSSLSHDERQILKNSLFDIFDKHLEREANIKKRASLMHKEVLAELHLKFSELLYDIKNNPTLEIFIDKLNKYTPSFDTLKPEFTHNSLTMRIYDIGSSETLADRITEEDLPVPKSAIEKEKTEKQLNVLINNTGLSDIIDRRIQKRIEGHSLADIAKEENVNVRIISESLRKGILRIRKSIDNLPPEYIERARELAAIFGCSEEKTIKILSQHTDFLSKKTETILYNIKRTAELLECTEKELIDAGLKQPTIFEMKPETISKRVAETSEYLNYDRKKFIQLALKKQPCILYLNTENLAKNVKESSKIIGCTEQEFISISLREPTLFYMKPETIKNNIKTSISLLNCSEEDYIHAAIKQTNLFYFKPETLKNNADKSSELLNCSVEDFVNAAMKMGSLLYQKPETLKKNAQISAKLLGITEEEFVKMALRHPPLFGQKPETLRRNAEGMAKVLSISVREYVRQISGRPATLSQKPETLKKKIEINNYFQKIKNEKPQINILQSSDDKLYLRILAYLLQQLKDKELTKFILVKRNFDFEAFLKAFSDRKFNFEIPDDKVAEDFVKFVQETSINTIGKNIFEFKITESKVA